MSDFSFGELVVPRGFAGPVDVDFGEDVSAATITFTVYRSESSRVTYITPKTGTPVTDEVTKQRFAFTADDTAQETSRHARFDVTFDQATNVPMHGRFVVEET